MRELDTFWKARRALRVDDRAEVVGRDLAQARADLGEVIGLLLDPLRDLAVHVRDVAQVAGDLELRAELRVGRDGVNGRAVRRDRLGAVVGEVVIDGHGDRTDRLDGEGAGRAPGAVV